MFAEGKINATRPTESMETDPEIEEKFGNVHSLSKKEYEDEVIHSDWDVCVMFYNSAYPHELLKPIAAEFSMADQVLKKEGYPMAKAFRYDLAKNPAPDNIDASAPMAIHFFPSSRKEPPYTELAGSSDALSILKFI